MCFRGAMTLRRQRHGRRLLKVIVMNWGEYLFGVLMCLWAFLPIRRAGT